MARAPITCGILILFGITLAACGSYEKKQTLEAINTNKEIVKHGGHVKKLTFADLPDVKGIARFEADILNDKDEVIGKVRGGRIEGFGTHIRRITWGDESDEPARRRPGQRRRRPPGMPFGGRHRAPFGQPPAPPQSPPAGQGTPSEPTG